MKLSSSTINKQSQESIESAQKNEELGFVEFLVEFFKFRKKITIAKMELIQKSNKVYLFEKIATPS